jgi:cell division protein FtsB
MSIEVDVRPLPRKQPSGPEPLRRKRVETAPVVGATVRRKALNIILGFAAAVLLIDAFVGEKGLIEGLRAQRSYEDARSSLNALKAENLRLLENVRRLREDQSAVEAIAREELGFIRPGEVLFIVREATPPARASSVR